MSSGGMKILWENRMCEERNCSLQDNVYLSMNSVCDARIYFELFEFAGQSGASRY